MSKLMLNNLSDFEEYQSFEHLLEIISGEYEVIFLCFHLKVIIRALSKKFVYHSNM